VKKILTEGEKPTSIFIALKVHFF